MRPWGRFARNHTRFDAPKLLAPAIAAGSCFAADLEGHYYFVGSGGGGGGGYGIQISPDCGVDSLFVLGVLNAATVSFFLKKTSSPFRGGYIALNRQYIEGIPVPTPPKKEQARIASLASNMLSLHKRLAAEQVPQRREQIQREIDATDRQIDQLVYQLYSLTDDEIAIVEEATR